MAARLLFFDDAGRVLMVNPVNKDYLPGGALETNESPRQGGRRACRFG